MLNKDDFSFELKDSLPPETVIEEALNQIGNASQGYVIGEISIYEGDIASDMVSTLTASLEAISQVGMPNVQKDLGEINPQEHKYEVFLSVKGLEHYKYRMMFIKYETISYPVMVILNEDLAEVYNGKRSGTLYIKTMNELEEMIETIINSETIITLIQNLINESIRQEQMKKDKAN